MTNYQSKYSKRIAIELASLFKKKYSRSAPYTIAIIVWNDGDFQVKLFSTIFLGGFQKDEILKDCIRVRKIEIIWHHGKIIESDTEEANHRPRKLPYPKGV